MPPHVAYVAALPCETSMSTKRAINDKSQGSVATYLTCCSVVNNQIKKGLLLSLRVKNLKSVNIGKVTSKNVIVSCTFFVFSSMLARRTKCARQWLLLVTLPNIHRFKTKFTHRRSNKPFLISLLTIPAHLKYVATVSCNLSLMACFIDINVSQGSVATYTRCGGIFNIHFTANLP